MSAAVSRITGGSKHLLKKDLAELEGTRQKLRRQFDTHIQCVDNKAAFKAEVLQEWSDFLRKKAEAEVEYSKSLERIADKSLASLGKLKPSSSKGKDSLPGPSSTTYELVDRMVSEAKSMAQKRAIHTDRLSSEVNGRIEVIMRDSQLVSKKIRDSFLALHNDMQKVYQELVEATRSYQQLAVVAQDAHEKLLKVQAQRAKGKKGESGGKKEIKFLESLMVHKKRAIKQRNEYLLLLRSANTITHRYFGETIFDLFELMDYDFQSSVAKIYKMQSVVESSIADLHGQNINEVSTVAEKVELKTDMERFVVAYGGYFMPPPDFQFLPCGRGERAELLVLDGFLTDLQSQCALLSQRVDSLSKSVNVETERLSATKELLAQNQQVFFNMTELSEGGDIGTLSATPSKRPSVPVALQHRRANSAIAKPYASNDRWTNLESMFNTIQQRCLHNFELASSVSQHSFLDSIICNITPGDAVQITQNLVKDMLYGGLNPGQKKKASKYKLFNGSIDLTMAHNGGKIPTVVTSCIAFIEEHGTRTEGVFRVPGVLQHIEELKNLFEDGQDPLTGNISPKSFDVHTVASLLKQYFRDLAQPLFPPEVYLKLIEVYGVSVENDEKRIELMSELVANLPPCRLTVLREVATFLEKFAEHSAHTKMTMSNLSLVFGPTLMAPPPETDPILAVQQLSAINAVCYYLLQHQHDILPSVSDDNCATTDGANEAASDLSSSTPTADQSEKSSSPLGTEDGSVSDQGDSDDGGEGEESKVLERSEAPLDSAPNDSEEQAMLASIAYEKIAQAKVDIIQESESDSDSEGEDAVFVLAVHHYKARSRRELSFSKGDMIEVFSKSADGNWWDSIIDGERGYIPVSYVREMPKKFERKAGSRPVERFFSQRVSPDDVSPFRRYRSSSSHNLQAFNDEDEEEGEAEGES